jgi:hypothetical protein
MGHLPVIVRARNLAQEQVDAAKSGLPKGGMEVVV